MSAGGGTAFIFDGSHSTDLNTLIADPRWVLGEARAINNAGQITGSGLLDDSVDAAYLLTPEPVLHTDSLLQFLAVSFGVKVDAGGQTSGGPVGPIDPGQRDALLGLAFDAAARGVGDKAGREAIRVAALEMTRRSVDGMIAQAKAPASRRIRAAQSDSTPRAGGRFTGLTMRPKGGPKKG